MTSKTAFARKFSLALFLLVATTKTLIDAKPNGESLRRLQSAEQLGDQISAAEEKPYQDAVMDAHEQTDLLSPSKLEQVHVITRHGSRSMMSKDADTLAEEGGATLTTLGQRQLYELGLWLRATYKDFLGNGKSLEHYNPSLHRFESTNLDRTLSSANSLAMGLFPSKTRATGIQNVDPNDPDYDESMLYTSQLDYAPAIPVYTGGKDHNDVTLRAYRNCPTFTDRLQQKLYKHPDWISLERMNSDLLEKLGRIFPELAVDGKVPLRNVWNAYDPIHVAKTECSTESNCAAFVTHETLATALSEDEFYALERLFEHVEHLKFGRGLEAPSYDGVGIVTAGNLLGSNLLWKILNRAKGDGDFFLYSAHGPTLLGFLSTLQASEDFFASSAGEWFVDYGAALIVEIHKSTDKGKYFFVLKYKSMERDDAVTVVLRESTTGIKCGQELSEVITIPKASWCSFDEVVTWASIYTLTSEKMWCTACGNRLADVCISGMSSFDSFSSSASSSSSSSSNTGGSSTGSSTTSKGTSMMTEHNQVDAWMASSEFLDYDQPVGSTAMICILFFSGFGAGAILIGLVWFSTSCCYKKKIDRKTGEDRPSSPTITVTDNEDVYGSKFEESNKSAEKLNGKEIC
mmetsp:Transcript_26369/g.61771  ORF Transcript_26369/g.61771 Transcript_26369/m.61771 type:complete len:631 (+) Transcript_26369:65-1957(+)